MFRTKRPPISALIPPPSAFFLFPALCVSVVFSSVAFAQSPVPAPSPSATPSQFTIPSSEVPIPTTGIVVPLWPAGKMPGHGADESERHNNWKPGGYLRITDVSDPTIEIFKAPHASGPVPAVIICPGGGYGMVGYDVEGTQPAAWLNSLGITGIYLKYRVPKNRDGAFQDIQRAVRLVRSRAAEWNIDPAKVGALGFSAGGHLAARLSTNFAEPAYPEIDSADKLSCRPDFVMLVYPAYLEAHGKLAPELPITPAIPQTLIVHNEDDPGYLRGSRIYDAALTAANIPHQFLLYHTGGHGYGLHSNGDVKLWPSQAADWLKKIGILQK